MPVQLVGLIRARNHGRRWFGQEMPLDENMHIFMTIWLFTSEHRIFLKELFDVHLQMLFGSCMIITSTGISHPLHPRDGWERHGVAQRPFLDGVGESIGRGITTCEVISYPRQSDRGVLVLLKPNVLQQRQKVSVPPPVGET